ncbi:MAG: beta-lactamase family protein [Candidatus Hydrogenedentes bacterium]|nr:beta-lactamase family protein [Candidatus Hydrogenedentota bacterium]
MIKPDGSQPPGPNTDAVPGLQGSVDGAVHKYMQSKRSAGLAVGVIADGEVFSFFHGSNGRDGSATPDENCIFEVGSITKVFTATLLADMHLRKEVHLDDPVNKYLPASAKLPSRGGVDVTLRHLATHTSGLPRLPENLSGTNFNAANPYAHYTEEDLYVCLAKTRLTSKPGTKSNYSNLGFGLLGHVLAKAAGTDFETLIKQRICKPLGLIDTTIHLSQEQQQRLAAGHSGGKRVLNWDLAALAGAGALRSSLRDMLRFLRANLEPSSTPLEAALNFAHEIQTERKYRFYRDFGCVAPLVVAGLSGVFVWRSFGLPVWARVTTILAIPAVMFYFWPLGLSTMTLGWHVDDLLCDKPVLWHNGGTGGYASYMAFLREPPHGVIVLANSDQEPDSVARKLLQGLPSKPAG